LDNRDGELPSPNRFPEYREREFFLANVPHHKPGQSAAPPGFSARKLGGSQAAPTNAHWIIESLGLGHSLVIRAWELVIPISAFIRAPSVADLSRPSAERDAGVATTGN
jgi:hypothetical protein